mmetsp:Transcript_19068/g.55404  ORF Transcript_19068/g.55404 Transcript_19068/m.55404 type:complete len:330 (-) Transcript_19068:1283-2272(-)
MMRTGVPALLPLPLMPLLSAAVPRPLLRGFHRPPRPHPRLIHLRPPPGLMGQFPFVRANIHAPVPRPLTLPHGLPHVSDRSPPPIQFRPSYPKVIVPKDRRRRFRPRQHHRLVRLLLRLREGRAQRMIRIDRLLEQIVVTGSIDPIGGGGGFDDDGVGILLVGVVDLVGEGPTEEAGEVPAALGKVGEGGLLLPADVAGLEYARDLGREVVAGVDEEVAVVESAGVAEQLRLGPLGHGGFQRLQQSLLVDERQQHHPEPRHGLPVRIARDVLGIKIENRTLRIAHQPPRLLRYGVTRILGKYRHHLLHRTERLVDLERIAIGLEPFDVP